MTISSETNRLQFAGSGTTGPFTITSLEIQNDDQVEVTHTDALGVNTTFVKTTDYSIDTGLTELTTVASVAAGETLTVVLSVPSTQGIDYKNTGTFNAEVNEDGLDKLTLINKQQNEELGRALKMGVESLTSDVAVEDPVAGKGLRWNDAGDGLINSADDLDGITGAAGASAIAAAASAAAALVSETNAGTSETNAATSETNAATSETNAGISETNSAASAIAAQLAETNAETAETGAALSAAAALISEGNASTSETNAGLSETNAAASALAAGTSETNAAASALAAGISETNAATSETNTGLDAIATAADVVSTNADVLLTNADVVSTGLDVVATNADVVLTGLDVVATNADVVSTNADVVSTNADVLLTNADVVSTNADAAAAALSETNAGTSATNAATSETNAATSETNAGISETNALASEVAAAASAALVDPSNIVVDTFTGDDATTVFILSQAVAGNNTAALDIVVGGVSIAPSEYNLAGTTLTFNDAPPVASITARHLGASSNTGTTFETKVSSNDTTEAFLEAKIVAGTNVTVATLNDGANETLEVTGLSNAQIKTAYESNADTNEFSDAEQTKVGHLSVTQAVDLDAIETRVNALDAAVVLQGSWDASVGTFPGGGTAQAGDSWVVSVTGTVDSVVFTANDRILALADNASTTIFGTDWLVLDYTDQVASVGGQTGIITLADLNLVIGTDVQAHSAVLDATTASFLLADETKLDGIETAATADQTGAEIKVAYEAEANTNAFTDAEQTKLGGVEASADVTDETNVTTALDGATLTAITVAGTDKVLLQDVSDVDNLKTVTAQSIADLAPSLGDGDKGDISVTSSGTVWTIDPDAVTYDKMQDTTITDVVLGRSTIGGGTVEEIAMTAAGRALIDDLSASAQRTTLGLAIGTDVQAHSAVLDATTASFLTADETKLDGIEAAADVTDEANVTTALDGATLTGVTVVGTDKVLLQDVSDLDNLKTVTAQSIADLSAGLSDGDKGDITVSASGTVWTIDPDTVTYDKMQDTTGTNIMLGRSTAGAGTVEEISVTAAGRALLDDVSSSAQRTTLGLAIGTDVQAHSAVLDATTASFLTADETKLDGIEAGAEVNTVTATSTTTFTNKTFDANGTGNSLSNVDVADLSNGTDGELITWDAAGAPATVPVGTATHVLTSNGVGTAPTFQAAAGGGGSDSLPKGGYVTGRYYPGFYFYQSGTNAFAADTIYGHTFLIADAVTLTGITINVTATGTASNARIGIYNMENGIPTTLVADSGTLDVSTTGVKEAVISETLDPGAYCMCAVMDGTVTMTRAVNHTSAISGYATGQTSATGSSAFIVFTASHTFAAVPASYPTVTIGVSGGSPYITVTP